MDLYGFHAALTATDDSTICNYGWGIAARNAAIAVRFVRGHKMRTVDALYNEFAAAFQFPYYFGENWPAFEECMGDLSWLPASNYTLIITHADEVLQDEQTDIPSLYRSLGLAGQSLQQNSNVTSPDVFRVILQCEPPSVERFEKSLIKLGAQLNRIEV